MITTKNNFSGADFDYRNNAETCFSTGEFRYDGEKLSSVNINGQLTKDEVTYNFWANMDSVGNVNISGVPAIVIADVAAEVAEIISEIENQNAE